MTHAHYHDSYFDLPFHSSSNPSFLFFSFAGPPADAAETPRPGTWQRVMQDGAFTNTSSAANSAMSRGPRDSSVTAFGVDPPRPPREGYDTGSRFWKWRSRSTKSASESEAVNEVPHSHSSISAPQSRYEQPQVWSPYLSESAHVFSLQHPAAAAAAGLRSSTSHQSSESVLVSPASRCVWSDDIPESVSPESTTYTSTQTVSPDTPLLSPRALYMKAKKEIEAKLKNKKHGDTLLIPGIEIRSMSQRKQKYEYLPAISDDLRRVQSAGDGTRSFLFSQHISKTKTWYGDDSGASKIARKIFGKAPWHRRESGDSFINISSSIKAVLRGRSPPSTPTASLSYTNSFQFGNNPFPGGEAVRVSTPPMDEDTADGKPRGFFTAMTPPILQNGTETVFGTTASSTRSGSRYSIHGNNMTSQPREWWEQKPQRMRGRNILDSSARKFEFDVPEHLPSSPMCPANSRHKSGGTGLCVYHGRRRAKSTLREENRADGSGWNVASGR
ncbi:hypothetical protein PT974_12074 [Cladobotryum mycophilum]|uniref:Uncharacterized protein n=1 Tax=Cladobotryum mycophilum TaxID=491253 RepID=A0ABR0S6Z7_9HYPO